MASLPLKFFWCALLIMPGLMHAGDVLFIESFENFDLKKLPPGWSTTNSADLAIVDEPGHGKVFRISHKGNGYCALSVSLDPGKVRGHQIRVAASAKFPGNYKPIQGQEWARPKLQLLVKDKAGKDNYFGQDAQPNKPEWQDLQCTAAIDKDADKIEAYVRLDLVAAEVFFDDFSVEVDPAPNSVPPKGAVAAASAAPATPTAPAVPGAPAPPDNNQGTAAKAPKKTLDDGGMIFSPELAAALQKARGTTAATPNTLLFAGPGLPIKELDGKHPDKWTVLAVKDPKELIGPLAGPRGLLISLPDQIAKEKPEVVVLFGDMTPGRKLTSTEQLDWCDVARLCLRMGTLPVLAIPPGTGGGEKEQLHVFMLAALDTVTDKGCLAIELKAPTFVPRRIAEMTNLLDKFVFCRISPDAPVTGKKPEDE